MSTENVRTHDFPQDTSPLVTPDDVVKIEKYYPAASKLRDKEARIDPGWSEIINNFVQGSARKSNVSLEYLHIAEIQGTRFYVVRFMGDGDIVKLTKRLHAYFIIYNSIATSTSFGIDVTMTLRMAKPSDDLEEYGEGPVVPFKEISRFSHHMTAKKWIQQEGIEATAHVEYDHPKGDQIGVCDDKHWKVYVPMDAHTSTILG